MYKQAKCCIAPTQRQIPRVDSCFCQLNVTFDLVVPILEAKVVTGVVEVLSPRVDAFNATHVDWLTQLAEFIQVLRGITTPARTKSVLQTIDEKVATGQPTKSADGAASRQMDEETGLAVIRDILQHRVGTATWDEISQELVSRFRIPQNS